MVDYPMEGETCLGKQSDGSCQTVYIPDCVDRNVYCSNVSTPARQVCGLYSKSFTIVINDHNDSMIVIYDNNDSGPYYKTAITAKSSLN